MIVNRFSHKHGRAGKGLHGGGIADEAVRKGLAYAVRRATPLEEATSKPGFAGERHALLLSQDGKRYVSHNYSGPQTRVDGRLARGDRPVDQVDACSMVHDISYNSMSKAAKAGKLSKAQHLQGIKSADAKFRACASSATDRPLLGKVASSAIGAKAFAENIGIIPTSMFSGAGIKINAKPADKLRRMALLAVKRGTNIVQVEPEAEQDNEVPMKKRIKKVGLNTSALDKEGGFPPLLVGLAASLLASLAEKGIEKLVEHFVGKKGSGMEEGMSKQDKIDYLLKNVNPTLLINEVQGS